MIFTHFEDQDLMSNDPRKQRQEQLLIYLDIFLKIQAKLMFQRIHRNQRKVRKKSEIFNSSFLTNLERFANKTCDHMNKLKNYSPWERSVDDSASTRMRMPSGACYNIYEIFCALILLFIF